MDARHRTLVVCETSCFPPCDDKAPQASNMRLQGCGRGLGSLCLSFLSSYTARRCNACLCNPQTRRRYHMTQQVRVTVSDVASQLPTEIYENAGGDAYVIEIPVPGVRPDEIVIEATVDGVTVSTEP